MPSVGKTLLRPLHQEAAGRVMGKYSLKNAFVDLGFVDGYLRSAIPESMPLYQTIVCYLDIMEESVTMEGFHTDSNIYRLGFIRGSLWLFPVANAFTEAMDRLMEYVIEGDAGWYGLPRPWRPTSRERVDHSDEVRDRVNETYVLESAQMAADENDLTADEVELMLHPSSRDAAASATPTDPNPIAIAVDRILTSQGRGNREWTTGQRAAQAARARAYHDNSPPLIPEEKLNEVAADFDSGMTFHAMGGKYGCSGSHIRNFLTAHGIDPRRGPKRAGGGKIEPPAE